MKFDNVIDSILYEKDIMASGLSAGMSLEDIAKKHNVSIDSLKAQLAMGIEVEKEHTDNPKIAEKVAKDHLVENPQYYSILKKAKL